MSFGFAISECTMQARAIPVSLQSPRSSSFSARIPSLAPECLVWVVVIFQLDHGKELFPLQTETNAGKEHSKANIKA
jgi:hypothetical protein